MYLITQLGNPKKSVSCLFCLVDCAHVRLNPQQVNSKGKFKN